MQYTFSVSSGADCLQLQQSWRRVVEAHPILRTRFYPTATGLFQVVLKHDFHWKELKGTDYTEFGQRVKSDFHLLTDGRSPMH